MPKLKGNSADSAPAVAGVASNGGPGVSGESQSGAGVVGTAHGPNVAGVLGVNDSSGALAGPGGWFESQHGEGLRGVSNNLDHGGVVGVNIVGGDAGYFVGNVGVTGGVVAQGGVVGQSDAATGVQGGSKTAVGVWGQSESFEAVHAECHSPVTAAVAAYNLNPDGTGAALFAKKVGPAGHSGFFDGPVYIVGELTITGALNLTGADYAEAMDTAEPGVLSNGMVVVIDEAGRVRPCSEEYDSRVAGVVSGAGGVPAAVVLDRHEGAVPVALMGKLWVLATAEGGPICCGDVLTTSRVPGHARRVTEPHRAVGAIVGKALTPLASGSGLIRVLVSAH